MGAGAIALILLNNCVVPCQIGFGIGLTILCVGLFLMLAGFMTAVSAVLRVDRQTYVVVTGVVLLVAAAGLTFALTFDPLF